MAKIILGFLLIATLILPQAALSKSKVELAKDYVTIGRNYDASNLLEQAILSDPLDADLHYEAGLVYLTLGQNHDFDLAMKNTCKLKPSNCSKVVDIYYNLGATALDSQDIRTAIKSFNKAMSYRPESRKMILGKIANKGDALLAGGLAKSANNYYSALCSLDESFKQRIADNYFNAGKKTAPTKAHNYFYYAIRFSKSYEKKVGHTLAIMAKNSKDPAEKEHLKREASTYLTDDEMLVYFIPDYKIYKRGTYIFNLKAGQTIDHWIMFQKGIGMFKLSSKDKKFIVTSYEGESRNFWEKGSIPKKSKYKFKITAVTDQEIKLLVQ